MDLFLNKNAIQLYINDAIKLVCDINSQLFATTALTKENEVVKLKNMAILPAHHGKGFAKQSIDQAIQLANMAYCL